MSLNENARLQASAVLREYQEAVQTGNLELAERIRRANPDLFDDEGEPLW